MMQETLSMKQIDIKTWINTLDLEKLEKLNVCIINTGKCGKVKVIVSPFLQFLPEVERIKDSSGMPNQLKWNP